VFLITTNAIKATFLIASPFLSPVHSAGSHPRIHTCNGIP